MYSTTTPCETAINATPICAISLIHALIRKMSSMMPTTTSINPPIYIAISSGDILQKTSVEITKPVKIAKPPILGIGFLCILRLSFGTSMAPIRYASTRTAGVVVKAMSPASAAATSR